MALITGGTITGLGIASMHYLGMAGMRVDARLAYDTPLVALSVVIAGCAATGRCGRPSPSGGRSRASARAS